MSTAPFNALQMIDVGRKPVSRRTAVAMGKIFVGAEAFTLIQSRKLPKGDALIAAEITGIQGAKNASTLLPLCHPLSLDHVRIAFEWNETEFSITSYCTVSTAAKTGVEMEALAGVNAALLCIYDLTKMVNPHLKITDTQLLLKMGGKSGVWVNPEGVPDWVYAAFLEKRETLSGVRAGVITLSDRASAGDYQDESGCLLQDFLKQQGADIVSAAVLPDDKSLLIDRLNQYVDQQIDLIITTGGTGLTARDITPDVLHQYCDRMIPGIGELLRAHGAQFTPLSFISRSCAGTRGCTLIVALPGNPKAIKESMPVLVVLLHHLVRSLKEVVIHD